MRPRSGITEIEWSTSEVDPRDAFDYWRDVICDAFVELSARPRTRAQFSGSIHHRAVGGLRMSIVTAGPQEVDRTRGLIARAGEEYLLASIQLDGQGHVVQDGREARLTAGSMAFYDSTRPYTLRFDAGFRQLVVQVPKVAVGRARYTGATAVPLDRHGPGRLVSDFFVGLFDEPTSLEQARLLTPHAIGLLDLALGLAGGSPTPTSRSAALAEIVHRAVVAGAGDPGLDAGALAAACRISRRTLFRVLAEQDQTFTAVVRAERVRRAAALLRSEPELPLSAIAHRSGFLGETQLHRAFRRERAMTPGAYRNGA